LILPAVAGARLSAAGRRFFEQPGRFTRRFRRFPRFSLRHPNPD
jgi:hypothetical protein